MISRRVPAGSVLIGGGTPEDDGYACQIGKLRIIVSWGYGWEHASVSTATACPTWAQMCFVKDILWDAEDVVVQYHPKKSQYVNCHPYCLHMWRPTEQELPTPHAWMVGPMTEGIKNVLSG